MSLPNLHELAETCGMLMHILCAAVRQKATCILQSPRCSGPPPPPPPGPVETMRSDDEREEPSLPHRLQSTELVVTAQEMDEMSEASHAFEVALAVPVLTCYRSRNSSIAEAALRSAAAPLRRFWRSSPRKKWSALMGRSVCDWRRGDLKCMCRHLASRHPDDAANRPRAAATSL